MLLVLYHKGLSIKDVRSQGGGGCPVRKRTEGVLQMRTSALFSPKKHRIFQNLLCPHWQGRGLSQCEQGEEGVNFSWFCSDVFYGRPLCCLGEGLRSRVVINGQTKS